MNLRNQSAIPTRSRLLVIASLYFATCLTAITLNAAHALSLKEQGALIEGMSPRFSMFECNSVDEITYSWGRNFSTYMK